LVEVVTVLLLAALMAAVSPNTTAEVAGESQADRDARMGWWREARFGMFIHWGLYAIPAGEWNDEPVKKIGEWNMFNGQIPVEEYEPIVAPHQNGSSQNAPQRSRGPCKTRRIAEVTAQGFQRRAIWRASE
jgi:Alpha-L-fucosidase